MGDNRSQLSPDRICAIPRELSLQPVSRRPTTLIAETAATAARLFPPCSTRKGHSPHASIIIITFNGELFTRMCIASLIENTDTPDFEIIIVDNGSSDGTVTYLRQLTETHRNISVIYNASNRGFAAANNQALALARGQVLVLLNNDTIVPPGWLQCLHAHLADRTIGMVGPTTNRAQNEARIETSYETYQQFIEFAQVRYREHRGSSFDIPMLMMFATAIPRSVLQQVGPLDENFGVGMFEDDDYALRVRAKGFRVVCANDALVHHFGQAAFGTLKASGEYDRIFDSNRRYFEQKWQRKWFPHEPGDQYAQLILSVANALDSLIGTTSPRIVSVIGYGDDKFRTGLAQEGRSVWHFPRQPDGSPLGRHPDDGAEALQLLRRDRAAGAGYLVIPKPSFWWFEHYAQLRLELDRFCKRLNAPDGCCAIFDLTHLPFTSEPA